MNTSLRGSCFRANLAYSALLCLLGGSAALPAQTGDAPSALPPAPAVAGNISTWPAAGSITPGTHLLLTTTRYYGTPYECRLESLDERGLTCRGPHHRPVVYGREMVRTIGMAREHLRHAYIGFVVTGALLTGGGFACALAAGGVGCGIILATGLGASLVAGILHSIDQLRKPGDPTPIYIAPAETATP